MILVGLIIILVAGLLLLLFVGALGKHSGGARRGSKTLARTDLNPQFVAVQWRQINDQMHSPSGLKNALIEADKLLDYVLKGRGYGGETMAERLKKAQSQLRDRESVWSAHKLRNMLVHEAAIDIVPQQVQHAVRALGQAIRDLGVPLT